LAIPEQIPEDFKLLARAVDSIVDRLSLDLLVASYSGKGDTSHRPDLMLKAVLFLTLRGSHSPAYWFFQSRDSRAVAWILRGIRPSRACWYTFRRRLIPLIDDLNRQILQLAHDHALLIDPVPVLDGTLLSANSSRHKLINLPTLERRLLQLADAIAADEAAALKPDTTVSGTSSQDQPSTASAGTTPASAPHGPEEPTRVTSPPRQAEPAVTTPPTCVQEAPATTPEDPARPKLPVPAKPAGSARAGAAHPAWMAQTPAGREEQQERYQKALQELGKRLEQNAKRRKEDRKDLKDVRVSLGDPEATLGLDKERVYRPLFNGQIAVDLNTDFYLGYAAFSGVQDGATLMPMVDRLPSLLPWAVLVWVLVDAGYTSGRNLREAEKKKVGLIGPVGENDYSKGKKKDDPAKQIPKSAFVWDQERKVYVCPQGKDLVRVRTETKERQGQEEKHDQYQCIGGHCQACPERARCTKSKTGRIVMRNEFEEEMARQRERMAQPEAQELYRKRKEQVERGIADTKQQKGLRRLTIRGTDGAQLQLGLVALAQNIVVFDKLLAAKNDANHSRS
jgi:hypothetical protein